MTLDTFALQSPDKTSVAAKCHSPELMSGGTANRPHELLEAQVGSGPAGVHSGIQRLVATDFRGDLGLCYHVASWISWIGLVTKDLTMTKPEGVV